MYAIRGTGGPPNAPELYPVAIVHEWNTIPHLNDYEGGPEARPFTREELQRFFDYADNRVEQAIRMGRKGALAAYRDATVFKVVYGWGLFSGARPLCWKVGFSRSCSSQAVEWRRYLLRQVWCNDLSRRVI